MIRPEDVTAEELAAFYRPPLADYGANLRIVSAALRDRRRTGAPPEEYLLCWVAALRIELARRRAGSPGA